MTLLESFEESKDVCYIKARKHPASDKFYLTQVGVWEQAYREAREEIQSVIQILKENNQEFAIDVIKRRLGA